MQAKGLKRTGFKPREQPMARGASTLKTTKPMNRGTAQLSRSTPMKAASKPMAAVGARARRTGQGKVAPTPAERAWMDKVAAAGCIVCLEQTGVATSAEIHHLKSGDRRMGHLFTLPLCFWHHRGGDKEGPYISRHPWKVRFEQAYGTELELLERLRLLIESQ